MDTFGPWLTAVAGSSERDEASGWNGDPEKTWITAHRQSFRVETEPHAVSLLIAS